MGSLCLLNVRLRIHVNDLSASQGYSSSCGPIYRRHTVNKCLKTVFYQLHQTHFIHFNTTEQNDENILTNGQGTHWPFRVLKLPVCLTRLYELFVNFVFRRNTIFSLAVRINQGYHKRLHILDSIYAMKHGNKTVGQNNMHASLNSCGLV